MNYYQEILKCPLESTLSLLAEDKFHSDQEIGRISSILYKLVSEVLKFILNPSINLEVVNDKNYRLSRWLRVAGCFLYI